MTSTIAIVGRPNVGKSTFFNRLKRSRDSIVDDQPGVTRDRLHALVNWDGVPFIIIDTGGFDDLAQGPLNNQVKQQILKAIDESDSIIFLMDGRKGLMPGDEEIAGLLRRHSKKTFVAVNKIDGPEQEDLILDFYRLGVEKIYPVSAAHGYGLKSLMEDVKESLPDHNHEPANPEQIRVAFLGRPNAGKSSLINRILGMERLLVSELPGTTRDSIDTLFTFKNREYLLIDTAGIRRKGKVRDKIDKFSMIKAVKSIDRCHVAVILVDANEGIAEQDARICGYAIERGRGIILAVNKWDLLKGDAERKKQLNLAVERQLQFMTYAPKITISALTGEKVLKLFEKINLVYDQFNMRISTGAVNRAIEEMILKKPPPLVGGTRLKFYYAAQTGTRPPTFVVFVNRPKSVHFTYERFMINQLRSIFNLENTPVRLLFRERKRDQK